MLKRTVSILAIVIGIYATPSISNVPSTVCDTKFETATISSEKLTNRVFREHGGSYRLSDGSMLKITKVGQAIFAESDELKRTEVKAKSPNQLVSLTGDVSIRFNASDSDGVIVSTSVQKG